MASDHRADDRARDQYRNPAETLAFFKIDPTMTWTGAVDEERLKNFVPADRGDGGHDLVLKDLREHLIEESTVKP